MSTPRVLLVYHSAEGQTAKVATRIAEVVTGTGATIEVRDAADAPAPDGHDLVVLGDSIHLGRHSRELTRWATRHRDLLDRAPLALFQVSLTSATDDDEHDAVAHDLVDKLIDTAGISPDMVGLFAGALAYTRYGWLKRKVLQRIARSEGNDTDTSVDHEYTDWDAVDDFARHAAALAATIPEAAAPDAPAARPTPTT